MPIKCGKGAPSRHGRVHPEQAVGGLGPGEQEALHGIAAALAQKLQLGVGLHALGGHAFAQAVGEPDDGSGDGAGARACSDISDERAGPA